MTEFILGNALIQCVGGITTIAQTIYGLIGYIGSESKTPIYEIIRDMDIEFKVKILESLLKDINQEHKNSHTIKLCLNELECLLHKIATELQSIKGKIKYNNSLWVTYFRTYDFKDSAETLKQFNTTLGVRSDMLFNILKIDNKLMLEKSIMLRSMIK